MRPINSHNAFQKRGGKEPQSERHDPLAQPRTYRGFLRDPDLPRQVPLVRFDRLSLLKVRDVLAAGMRLEPTGRNPRHYAVSWEPQPQLAADLLREKETDWTGVTNPQAVKNLTGMKKGDKSDA